MRTPFSEDGLLRKITSNLPLTLTRKYSPLLPGAPGRLRISSPALSNSSRKESDNPARGRRGAKTRWYCSKHRGEKVSESMIRASASSPEGSIGGGCFCSTSLLRDCMGGSTPSIKVSTCSCASVSC